MPTPRFELYNAPTDLEVAGLMGFTDSPRIAAEWQASGGTVLDTTRMLVVS